MEKSQVDPLLETALNSTKYKPFIAQVENNILDLLNSQEVQLEYFQLNSYYRLLIHKIGDYYGLARQIDNSRKCIILYKTSNTREPWNKLQNMTKKVSIMQRKVQTLEPSQQSDPQIHSLQDREAIYEATRARIFAEEAQQRNNWLQTNETVNSNGLWTVQNYQNILFHHPNMYQMQMYYQDQENYPTGLQPWFNYF